MSMSINFLGGNSMGVVAPHKERKKSPYVLDETIPKAEDPLKKLAELKKAQMLKNAKNKPDNERTFADYLVLAQDKLEKGIPGTVIY